jgi:hypothetical protein
MNSTLGMFLIEAAGFGRGLGVLDLNASKLADSFHLLNPAALNADAATKIKAAFKPLLARDADELPAELNLPDRLEFDACVAAAYGFSGAEDGIRDALQFLYQMRKSVLK